MNREQKKQQTKQQILDTACQLFKENGFENVSTRQIASACGIAIGTVFSHYQDKDELIKAIFHHSIEKQLRHFYETATEVKSGLAYFLGMAQIFYNFYQQDRAFSQTLLKNSMTDMAYFEQQMEGLMAQVCLRLTEDASHLAEQQKYVITKAWFGFYIFNVLSGLSQPNTDADDWHKQLANDCNTLLAAVSKT